MTSNGRLRLEFQILLWFDMADLAKNLPKNDSVGFDGGQIFLKIGHILNYDKIQNMPTKILPCSTPSQVHSNQHNVW